MPTSSPIAAVDRVLVPGELQIKKFDTSPPVAGMFPNREFLPQTFPNPKFYLEIGVKTGISFSSPCNAVRLGDLTGTPRCTGFTLSLHRA